MIKKILNKLKKERPTCQLVFEVFQGKKNKWYWRLKTTTNHKIVASSNQGYENWKDMIETISLIKDNVSCSDIINITNKI